MAAKWKGIVKTQDYWWPYVKISGANSASLAKMVSALNTLGGYSATKDKFNILYYSGGQLDNYLAAIIGRIWSDNDPAISHVMLYRAYFSYVTADWGGHYQIVRGYNLYPGGVWNPTIKLFEPFNEHRFYPSKPVTSGPRDVSDDKLLNATVANYGQLGA